MLVWKRILWLRDRVREQKKWIDRCGGNLTGYIERYGDPGVPPLENGEPKTVLVPADKAHLFDGRLQLHPDESKMPGINFTKFYAGHFGDGGTKIWEADHAALVRWETELRLLESRNHAAFKKANSVEEDAADHADLARNNALDYN